MTTSACAVKACAVKGSQPRSIRPRQVPRSIGDSFVFVYFLLNGVEQPFFDQTWQLPLFAPIGFTTP